MKSRSKIKILFINPPLSYPSNAKFTNLKLPLGFLYMAGVLEKRGFEVNILDCPLYYQYHKQVDDSTVKIGLPFNKIKEIICRFNPEIIGVSCAFSMYEHDSFELIDFIRKNFRKPLIIVGGAHSSANPVYVMRNKNIDMVVIGEGEMTMLEIAEKFRNKQSLNNLRGTAVRMNNKIKVNKLRDFIEDLDDLRPAWHLLDMEKYFDHPDNSLATMRKRSIDLITSRGCPANCVFCSICTVWGRKWRGRSPKNVVDEIEFLSKKYGAAQFRFQDDNLTLNKERIIEICNEIIKRKLDIKWDTPNGVALWSLDKEILLKMRQAGCYRTTFAVESGSKMTQKYIGKILDLEKINDLIDYCHQIKMWICATFIVGFPGEKIKDILETEKFMTSSKINFPFLYIAQPYQGTRMYEDFKKEGLIKEHFVRLSNVGKTYYDTLNFKSKELNYLRNRLYKRFYMKKMLSYMNPINFYSEFLSKVRSLEDVKYVIKMIKVVMFQ